MGFDIKSDGRWAVRIALVAAACNVMACLGAELSSRREGADQMRMSTASAVQANPRQGADATLLLGFARPRSPEAPSQREP